MPEFLTEGNKNVRCYMGHLNTIPFRETLFKCSTCDSYTILSYFGTITDKEGNHII